MVLDIQLQLRNGGDSGISVSNESQSCSTLLSAGLVSALTTIDKRFSLKLVNAIPRFGKSNNSQVINFLTFRDTFDYLVRALSPA